ncbi:MAG: hypothetical protein KHX31_03690 [Akkermansia sp.]|uniref:hypothetical protein n=1 Tax=Akkermansia sp. TaxID=1872421 RepID=UPI0025BA233B|nr:hypothetical protein [Akkermansia sp.]MBS5507717.1 hypothetical protein [Akkermansia sp.]
MFRFWFYGWVFALMAVFTPVRAGEEEINYPSVPEQYFAWEWKDAYWGNAAAAYWPTLFPENPPFRYACIYLGSFDQEFGFYLDGNTLYWAQSVGAQSRQMLSQKPIVNIQTRSVAAGASVLVCLWAPVVRCLLDGWDWILEENPFHVLGKGEDKWYVPSSLDGVMMAAARLESVVNPCLYSRDHVRRGHTVLGAGLAGALRQTLDEAVAKKTFFMRLYREYIQGMDGNYCYFRGGSGPASEDLCLGGSKMRCSMMDLAHGLMDMMMMDDLNPEAERWLLEQCARVRRHARELGDKVPPMVSDKWVRAAMERHVWCGEEKAGSKEGKGESASPSGAAFPAEEEEREAPSKPEPDKKAFVRGYKERFFKPLEENPLWRDLFPKGTEGKPAALWFGERGVTGIYIDGAEMGRAFARNTNPELMYRDYFFRGVPERRLCPYEGEPEENGEYDPRVKRAWMKLEDGLPGLSVMVLNRIARGELPVPDVAYEPREAELSVIVVRGDDGTTRILSSREKGTHAVVQFLESIYESYEMYEVEESGHYARTKYEALQGKEPQPGNREGDGEFGNFGRYYLW